jgi:hypothetical protein
MSDQSIGEVKWNKKLEEYFATTGEQAHCLSWIHKQSEHLYSMRRTWIDLPVIVGSGAIAFLNGSSSVLWDDAKVSSIALGLGSLAVGLLNTIGSYFGWAKRAEGHRISAIQYARLYRFLAIEMRLPRDERMSPHDLLKYTKDMIDRLQEISPLIPPLVVTDFRRRFAKETEIAKPEEANGLEKIEVYAEDDSLQSPKIRRTPSMETFAQNPSLSPPALPLHRAETRTGGALRVHLPHISEEGGNETAQGSATTAQPTAPRAAAETP